VKIETAKQLTVCQRAFELAMLVFSASKRFALEERYALTSQIRRSSRSICLNLREAWAKRRYPAHFVSKLTDCDGENSETDSSLDFAHSCGYLSDDERGQMTSLCEGIGRMLGTMIAHPDPFLIKTDVASLSSV
jgi:four helix bundle protein